MYSVLINKQNVIKEYVFKQNNQESEQGYDKKTGSYFRLSEGSMAYTSSAVRPFCNYDNLKTAVCVAYDTWS